MSVHHSIVHDTVSILDTYTPRFVSPSTPVREIVTMLQSTGHGCVLICEGDSLVGIFTERDLLMKVFGKNRGLEIPVSQVMTADPVTVLSEDSIAYVVKKMRLGGYRHIPVLDEQKRPIRVVSIKHIVHYLVEHFPEAVYNLPPYPDQAIPSREGA